MKRRVKTKVNLGGFLAGVGCCVVQRLWDLHWNARVSLVGDARVQLGEY